MLSKRTPVCYFNGRVFSLKNTVHCQKYADDIDFADKKIGINIMKITGGNHMKFRIVIGKEKEEEIVARVHKKTPLIDEI